MLQRYLYEIENYNNPFIPDLKEAIILTSKALREVKKSTVVNCWIHSGIIVYKEFPVAECRQGKQFCQTKSEKLIDKFKSNEDLSFDQYLASDDNLVDYLEDIPDIEIFNIVNNKEHQAEDVSEPAVQIPTSLEVKQSFKLIKQYFFHHTSVKSDHLDVIDKLETIIMDLINFNLNQKKIEDFMQRK